MTIPQRFVELALALDLHIPGYIDAYFGPPEWKEQSLAGGPRPIDDLAREAAELAAAIEQEPTFDDQRRDYLSRHVTAMPSATTQEGALMNAMQFSSLPWACSRRASLIESSV